MQILWGSTLWDPRVPSVVHRFDQFADNNIVNTGVFHPSGTNVIINSEIWDLRTFRSLFFFFILRVCVGLSFPFFFFFFFFFLALVYLILLLSLLFLLFSPRLFQSIPSLDSQKIHFDRTGTVIHSHLRRPSDDPLSALNPKRSRSVYRIPCQ